MIVSLDEEGSLVVNYLGTDPMSTAVGATETKEIDYEEIDAEHRELLGVIRSTQGGRKCVFVYKLKHGQCRKSS